MCGVFLVSTQGRDEIAAVIILFTFTNEYRYEFNESRTIILSLALLQAMLQHVRILEPLSPIIPCTLNLFVLY